MTTLNKLHYPKSTNVLLGKLSKETKKTQLAERKEAEQNYGQTKPKFPMRTVGSNSYAKLIKYGIKCIVKQI
jgi:hypothetical protein